MYSTGEEELSSFAKLPVAENCRLIPFSSAHAVELSERIAFLIVSGDKPYVNMKVYLKPRIYVTQPEYWQIDVVGCVDGIILPHVTPYVSVKNISSTRGTKGIEVVGFDSFERIDL
jgi:hypothetical protein